MKLIEIDDFEEEKITSPTYLSMDIKIRMAVTESFYIDRIEGIANWESLEDDDSFSGRLSWVPA